MYTDTDIAAPDDEVVIRPASRSPDETPAPPDRQAAKRGTLTAFVAAQANLYAPSVRAEARRLLPLATSQGISTTVASLTQAIRGQKQQHAASGKGRRSRDLSQDFAEVERLVADAVSALDKLRRFVPALRGEVQRHQNAIAKLRDSIT